MSSASPIILPAPVIVFTRPQAAGNIGALARAMSNFGVHELRLVGKNPADGRDPNDSFMTMDWALAKKGSDILNEAKWYPDIVSALHGIHVAVGTSGRDVEFERGYARPHMYPEQAFYSLQKTVEVHRAQNSHSETFQWSLVFGAEDDGLANHEAACCQKMIRVATNSQSPSLNIAMSAGLLLYHWHLTNLGVAKALESQETGAFLPVDRQFRMNHTEAGRGNFASIDQCEDFVDYLMDLIGKTDFLKYPDQEAVKARVRRWVQAAPLPLGELLFAFEILYHLKAWGTGKFETRDFLKRGRTKNSPPS